MIPHCCNRDCRRHGCPSALPHNRKHETRKKTDAPADAVRVPLFYLDQNQSLPTVYSVTAAQAEAMKTAGRGRFINRGRAFQLCERSPASVNFVCSQSGDSDPSISCPEMQANVGITANQPGESWKDSAPALRHVVDFAQKKIRAIGRREDGTFDEKAPLAFGPGRSHSAEAPQISRQ